MGEIGAERIGRPLGEPAQTTELAETIESTGLAEMAGQGESEEVARPELRLLDPPGPIREPTRVASRLTSRVVHRRPVIELPPPLAEIFPDGGLPRGAVTSLAGGTGRSSVLLALLAAAQHSWSAIVGLPDLGLLAGVEMGLDLSRVAIIPDPGPDVLQVLSILVDGFDLIAVASPGKIAPVRGRVLTGKLRHSGAVLLGMGGWPGADLVLRTRIDGWTGLGQGYGRLSDRRISVQTTGRRVGRPWVTSVLFRSSDHARVELAAVAPQAQPAHQPASQVG